MLRHLPLLAVPALALLATPARAQAAAQADTTPLALAAAPVLVGPGVISSNQVEFSPSVTPDGRTLYFTVTDAGFTRMTVMMSARRGDRWDTPVVAPFSGVWNDGDSSLSPDGSRLFFISNRPVSGTAPKADLDLWFAERAGDGSWREPRRLPDAINSDTNETYPSVARDGTLYYGRNGRFYRARLRDGVYGAPEMLPFSGFSIAVHPDQRYVIVGAPRTSPADMDLHVIWARGDGWSAPRPMAAPVNSPVSDLASWITPDGKTLYFVSTRRPADAVRWPRPRPARTYADVAGEFGAALHNGLRNIYQVDLEGLSVQ